MDPGGDRTVLVIEDSPGDARLLREMFRDGTHHIRLVHADCMLEGEKQLARGGVDAVLLDLGLPDAHGLEALRRALAAAPRVPVVVLTSLDDETLAVQALHEGAQDYLVKGQIEVRGLLRSLRYAIQRKHMEEALFAERERAQVTLDCIGDAVVCTNLSGRITFLNLAAQQMTGWSWREVSDRLVTEIFPTLGVSAGSVSVRHDRLLPGMESRAATRTLVRRDGSKLSVEDSVSSINDREGHSTGAVMVLRDVSVAHAMALQMAHLAEHDMLTGLPNRAYLNDRLSHAISLAQRHGKQVAVLYLDLDGFKHINDSLGHPVGDKLLKSIAERLVDCGRASDTVSRQGGDEFVVLLSEVQHSEDAAIAALRILRAVALPHCIDHHDLHVTTSIGVSIFPDDGTDAETLIRNADTAMYQAKEAGRHSYQYFRPAMNARAVERQSLEEGLRRALELHELSLHYQPQVNLVTGAINGVEALLRWTHPLRGLISPAQFIPVAEESALIVPIGSWVLRQACEQARAWVDAGLPPTTMAVNVSATEFRQEGFLAGLLTILSETGMDPQWLELELTESVLIKDCATAAATLRDLRAHGVRVAIDDFGTGYSSLGYLRSFRIDALKIDRSFVAEITSDPDGASIVIAVISLARSLHLRVVAEGVETSNQLQFLRAHGCDDGQGYHFSRPLAADACARLLARGRLPDLRGCAGRGRG